MTPSHLAARFMECLGIMWMPSGGTDSRLYRLGELDVSRQQRHIDVDVAFGTQTQTLHGTAIYA